MESFSISSHIGNTYISQKHLITADCFREHSKADYHFYIIQSSCPSNTMTYVKESW